MKYCVTIKKNVIEDHNSKWQVFYVIMWGIIDIQCYYDFN